MRCTYVELLFVELPHSTHHHHVAGMDGRDLQDGDRVAERAYARKQEYQINIEYGREALVLKMRCE